PHTSTYTPSLHDALPIFTVTPTKGFSAVEIILSINYILLKDGAQRRKEIVRADIPQMASYSPAVRAGELVFSPGLLPLTREGTVDRKSTRLTPVTWPSRM